MSEKSISTAQSSTRLSIGLISFAVALALLNVGQSFLIPLAIAVLVVNLLHAVVDSIAGLSIGTLKVPRWIAGSLAILLVLAGFFLIVQIFASQTDAISEAAPRYVARVEALVAKAVVFTGEEVAAAINSAIAKLDLSTQISAFVGSAGNVLSGFFLVVLYTGFMLAERGNLSRKFSSVFSQQGKAESVHKILQSISDGIRRYMAIKTAVSVLTGVISYIVLKLVGVDFAETWAVIIFLLNYIPSIGSIIGVAFPALLALLQFDTFGPFAIIAVGLGMVQFFIGNIIEPALTGRSLNLSSFVIILSLTFWGSLWGIMGMFLSVPIMVMTMIVCTNVPNWKWVAIMLSKDGNLAKE